MVRFIPGREGVVISTTMMTATMTKTIPITTVNKDKNKDPNSKDNGKDNDDLIFDTTTNMWSDAFLAVGGPLIKL